MSKYTETADIETSSDDYASRFSGEVGAFFLEVQLHAVMQHLRPYGAVGILDVGGGHGQLAIPLVEQGYDVTVTGSDDSCRLRLARSLAGDRCHYQTCDMLDLPYSDNSFDVVIAFRLLPHVVQWQKLIQELSRIARQAVIIDYPDIRSTNILNSLLFTVKKNLEGNTRPFTLFSRGQIAREFRRHGVESVSFTPEFFLPMVLHRKAGSAHLSRMAETFFRMTGLTTLLGSPIVAHMQKRR